MCDFNIRVEYWAYRNGQRPSYNHTGKLIYTFDESMKGWGCWVYTDSEHEFSKWMENNIVGSYELDYRFNSGDPMFTILIRDDEDATVYKLRWVV